MGGHNTFIMINSRSEKFDNAFEFGPVPQGPEGAEYLVKGGMLPSYSDDSITKLYQETSQSWTAQTPFPNKNPLRKRTSCDFFGNRYHLARREGTYLIGEKRWTRLSRVLPNVGNPYSIRKTAGSGRAFGRSYIVIDRGFFVISRSIRKNRRYTLRENLTGWVFLLPALAGFPLFSFSFPSSPASCSAFRITPDSTWTASSS